MGGDGCIPSFIGCGGGAISAGVGLTNQGSPTRIYIKTINTPYLEVTYVLGPPLPRVDQKARGAGADEVGVGPVKRELSWVEATYARDLEGVAWY